MMHTSFDRDNRRKERARAKREADTVRRHAHRHAALRPRQSPLRLRDRLTAGRGWWYRRQLARSYHTQVLPVPGRRGRLVVIAFTVALGLALGILLASLGSAGQQLDPAPLTVPVSPPPPASPAAQRDAAPAAQNTAPITASPAAPSAAPTLSIDVGRSASTMRVVGVGDAGLLLRSAPVPDAEPLKTLAEGSTLRVTGETVEGGATEWVPVRDDEGAEGWAALQFLAADSATFE